MRAAVWTGPDALEVREIERPVPPEGWVLLRSELTGLCGTDFSIVAGSHPRAAAPLVPGHEITGVVEVTAPGGPAVGTRVTVEPLISCGECHPCQHGETHVCQRLGLYGIDLPGSLAEYVAVPVDKVVPFAAGVTARQAAFAEPLAVAVHAVSRSGLAPGQRVLVFGAGPIGVLTALVARHAGAGEVWISEPSPARSSLARSLGFPAPLAGVDHAADVVFDSAAVPAVAAQLPRAARVRGTIVLVGVYKKPVELDLQAVTFAEQTLVGVRVYTRADVERAVELIEQDALGLDRLPVAVHPLEAVEAAFTQAMSAGEVLKVLVSADPALVAEGS